MSVHWDKAENEVACSHGVSAVNEQTARPSLLLHNIFAFTLETVCSWGWPWGIATSPGFFWIL